MSALPTDGLVLGVTMGYQDVQFGSISDLYTLVNGAAGPNAYLNSSVNPTLSPEWSGNLSANYTTDPLFDDAYLTFGVTGIWHDEIRFEPNPAKAAATPFGVAKFTPDAWLWNTCVSLKDIRTTDDCTGEISLRGRNLTDDDHMAFAGNVGAMVGGIFQTERSYGIDFVVNFK